MADGRQKAQWGHTATLGAAVVAALGGRVDPADLIPARYRDDPPEAAGADDGALGFEMLKHGLAAVAKQQRARQGG